MCLLVPSTDYGFDHAFDNIPINDKTFLYRFGNVVLDVNNQNWKNSVQLKSSLRNYALLKDNPRLEDYLLCNKEFFAASLKFKARSNTLQLNDRTYHWNNDGNNICPLCKNGIEDLKHFMFICKPLQCIRAAEYKSLENQLKTNNLEAIWQLFISSDLNVKTCFLLGLSKDLFVDIVSIDVNCALNIFDQVCKSFLKKAWCLRNEIVKA